MDILDDHSLLPKNRLEALTDGIFAITMTIIILDLKSPELFPVGVEEQGFWNVLLGMLPSLEAYVISFVLLGTFWIRQVIHFKYIKYVTRPLIYINICFLLLTGLVPFTVGMVMRYHGFTGSFRIYIINLLLLSILLSIQLIIILRNKKILEIELSGIVRRNFYIISFAPAVIFLLCFVISFINVRLALYLIYLDPIFYIFFRKFAPGMKSIYKKEQSASK